jgi:hypothetical protein
MIYPMTRCSNSNGMPACGSDSSLVASCSVHVSSLIVLRAFFWTFETQLLNFCACERHTDCKLKHRQWTPTGLLRSSTCQKLILYSSWTRRETETEVDPKTALTGNFYALHLWVKFIVDQFSEITFDTQVVDRPRPCRPTTLGVCGVVTDRIQRIQTIWPNAIFVFLWSIFRKW